MPNQSDIRWLPRFANYCKVLAQLTKFLRKKELNELEEQGLIQSFEYTYELAWNTIKDFYEDQGETGIQGSKDAVRLGYTRGLIDDAVAWMEMIESRKLTTHTYNESTALTISQLIRKKYYELFLRLHGRLEELKSGGRSTLI